MITKILGTSAAMAAATLFVTAPPAVATSGHFIQNGKNAPVCVDEGTTLDCSGKVAGLGGDTFQITVVADATAYFDCRNHGGNIAPGQAFDTAASGSSPELATPKNGQYTFGPDEVVTDEPSAAPETCPNDNWDEPILTDVEFHSATLQVFEDGVMTDSIEVAGPF